MTQGLAILLMLNNYVHDVATGLLLISALWLGWSARDLGPDPSRETLEVFRKSYRRCRRFLILSIGIIVATGVVRTLNFMRFEWFPALGKGLVPILIVKHVLIFTMLAAGSFAWVGLSRRLRSLDGWATQREEC